jgi:hypothetical protein
MMRLYWEGGWASRGLEGLTTPVFVRSPGPDGPGTILSRRDSSSIALPAGQSRWAKNGDGKGLKGRVCSGLGPDGKLNLHPAVIQPVFIAVIGNTGSVFAKTLYGESGGVDAKTDDRLGHPHGSIRR